MIGFYVFVTMMNERYKLNRTRFPYNISNLDMIL